MAVQRAATTCGACHVIAEVVRLVACGGRNWGEETVEVGGGGVRAGDAGGRDSRDAGGHSRGQWRRQGP